MPHSPNNWWAEEEFRSSRVPENTYNPPPKEQLPPNTNP